MKLLNLVIGKTNKDGKTFWHNIGTVFCSDNSVLNGPDGKFATFIIDYPEVNGIICDRKPKGDKSG